jgi:hypothetical protein
MKNGRLQAKDISTERFLFAVRAADVYEHNSVLRWDVQAVLAGFGHMVNQYGPPEGVTAEAWTAEKAEMERVMPWKVVVAKASSLIRQGILDGCDCGCRGDWRIMPS